MITSLYVTDLSPLLPLFAHPTRALTLHLAAILLTSTVPLLMSLVLCLPTPGYPWTETLLKSCHPALGSPSAHSLSSIFLVSDRPDLEHKTWGDPTLVHLLQHTSHPLGSFWFLWLAYSDGSKHHRPSIFSGVAVLTILKKPSSNPSSSCLIVYSFWPTMGSFPEHMLLLLLLLF